MNLTQEKNTLCEWLYSLQNLHLWMSGHDHFLEYFCIMECIILETWVRFLDLFLSGYEQVSGCKESQFYSLPFGQAVVSMY